MAFLTLLTWCEIRSTMGVGVYASVGGYRMAIRVHIPAIPIHPTTPSLTNNKHQCKCNVQLEPFSRNRKPRFLWELVSHLVAPENQRSHLPPDGATFLLAKFLMLQSLEAEVFELEPPGGTQLVRVRGQSGARDQVTVSASGTGRHCSRTSLYAWMASWEQHMAAPFSSHQ